MKTAGLMLDKANPDTPSTDPALWEKVTRRLRAGQMPPQGVPQPPPSERSGLAGFLEKELDANAAANPNP
ncbi:MAG TPA: hypothetical protein VMZ27_06290, partial [Candidatus Saccharimonadales bacterium]|nr:hypothetical protein [Candidatus Saccharimonadales bacterium]